VPDPNSTSLITRNEWTLRVRESTRSSPRLLLLIHGLTGDENVMWVFAQNLPGDYWMIAPRAPYLSGMEQGGYSWYPPESVTENRPGMQQLQPAAEALIDMVDEYAASAGLDSGRLDLIGFSQGAALCSALAFLYPQRIRKVGMLAGFVPGGVEPFLVQRPLEGKPFFIAHGTRDETVKIEEARAAAAILEEAGAQVTFCEDDVAHKVSVSCLRGLRDFFRD
jgi:phospholipase/carboxylesterase